MIDFGNPTIRDGMKAAFLSLNDEKKKFVFDSYLEWIRYKDSDANALITFFHESHRNNFDIESEGFAWHLLRQKMDSGRLFCRLIPMPRLAMPDKVIHELNDLEINHIEFCAESSHSGCDGYVKITQDIKLLELPANTELDTRPLNFITIKAGHSIPLEVGTNPITKFVNYLTNWHSPMRNDEFVVSAIARLPYESEIQALGIFASVMPISEYPFK